MPFVLVSCGNDVGFNVIDSDLWAHTPDNYIHWADEETVLFAGQINDEFIRNKKNYADIYSWSKDNYSDLIAWNYKTNKSVIVLDDSTMFCAEGKTVYFYRAGKPREYFKGELVRKNLDIQVENIENLTKNTTILINKPHCPHAIRKKSDISLIANLKAFNMELRKVWPEGTSLAEKRRGHHPTPITTLFSDKYPNGHRLQLGMISPTVSYIPHLNKYLLQFGKKPPDNSQSTSYQPLTQYWLFAEDGTLDEIPIPEGWDRTYHLFPSVKGPIATYLDMRKTKPKSGDNGAFLIVGDKREDAVKLLRGSLRSTSLSPDGCRLATAHFYKVIPFASNNPTLKVIDMCVE